MRTKLDFDTIFLYINNFLSFYQRGVINLMINRKIKILTSILIVSFMTILGIGYAAVSLDLTLDGDIDGVTQNEVFITDVRLKSDASNGEMKSHSFISSILTSNVELSEESSSVTYTIDLHNNGSEDYYYIGTLYDDSTELSSTTYSNTDIKFDVDLVEGNWDTGTTGCSKIEPNGSLTFDITFTYVGEGSTSLNLNSILNFKFLPIKLIHKATLIYEGNKYIDVMDWEDTVAEFPDVPITTSTTSNVIARCNNNTVPTFKNKVINITKVYSKWLAEDDSSITANNTNDDTKCQIYDSLGESISDATFESSNYTVNNFLMLSNSKELKTTYNNVAANNNKAYNINLNDKTLTLANTKPSSDENSDNRTINLVKNKTTINIYNGTINATKSALFRIDNANAKVTIGKMPSGSETAASVRTVVDFIPDSGDPNMFNLVDIFNGSIKVLNSSVEVVGIVFRVGSSAADEKQWLADGTKKSVNLECVDSDIVATSGSGLHTTTRQSLVASFVGTTMQTGNSVVIANNHKDVQNTTQDTEHIDVRVWRNVKIYFTDCNVKTINGYSCFFTYGAKIYLTSSSGSKYDANTGVQAIFVKDNNGVKTMISSSSSSIANQVSSTITSYYVIKNATTDTSRDWHYVKDSDGNRVVDVDGKNIKVGDPVQINSTLAANLVLSAADMGSYKYFQNLNSKGAVVWTSDKGPGQTFTFLAEGNNRYLMVMMYAPMYAMHFDKGDYVNQSSYPNARNCKLYNVSAKHEAFKFLIEKTGNGYSFVSLAGSNIKALYLDVFGGKTDNGSKVIGWDTKNSNASQVWTFTIRHSTTTIGYE